MFFRRGILSHVPKVLLGFHVHFPHIPLLIGSSFSAFDVDHVFQQGLGITTASFLHVLNSDLPISHISCCVPEYVFFGLSFSSQSHRSPFNSLASKAECLYKVSKHQPKYLAELLLVQQYVQSGLVGHLLLPPFLRPLSRTIPSTASFHILCQECSSCSSRHCCDVLACELVLAFLEGVCFCSHGTSANRSMTVLEQ